MDVTSLYTNILHDEARQVLEDVLDQWGLKESPTFFLLELAGLIMEKNYFRFSNTFDFQIQGVAMESALCQAWPICLCPNKSTNIF